MFTLMTLTVLWPLFQLLSSLSQFNTWFKWLHHWELLQLQNLNSSLWPQQFPLLRSHQPAFTSLWPLESLHPPLLTWHSFTSWSYSFNYFATLCFLIPLRVIPILLHLQAWIRPTLFSFLLLLFPVPSIKEETHITVPARSIIKIYNLGNPWNTLPMSFSSTVRLAHSSIAEKEVSLLSWGNPSSCVLDPICFYGTSNHLRYFNLHMLSLSTPLSD